MRQKCTMVHICKTQFRKTQITQAIIVQRGQQHKENSVKWIYFYTLVVSIFLLDKYSNIFNKYFCNIVRLNIPTYLTYLKNDDKSIADCPKNSALSRLQNTVWSSVAKCQAVSKWNEKMKCRETRRHPNSWNLAKISFFLLSCITVCISFFISFRI